MPTTQYHWRFYAETDVDEGCYLGEDYIGTSSEAMAEAYEEYLKYGMVHRIIMERRGKA